MYVRLRTLDPSNVARKPRILIVLQGEHHLTLYESIFKYCTQFDWYCLLPSLPSEQKLKQVHFCYGLRFFSDASSCLAHYGHFDAVITTWSIPHRKHLPYLKFIALAYELGLPVFELQHGLFQLGLTYAEDAPVIGSRAGAAIAAPDVNNLTSNVISWFGDGGIGYPRSPAFEIREDNCTRPREERVVFVTNHHWGILSEAERLNCYTIMYETICCLSAVEFVLLPHAGELKNPLFIEMVAKLDAVYARNYRIETRRGDGIYEDLLCTSKLIVGSISTTILDCELSSTPTVIFRNPSQDPLLKAFENALCFSTAAELREIIEEVLYRNFKPTLESGFSKPFEPERLTAILEASIAKTDRRSPEEVAVAVCRYLALPA